MDVAVLAPLLQVAVLGGITMSAIASIAVVTRSFLNRGASNAVVLSRVEKIETALRNDANRIDVQLIQASHGVKPERAKVVVDDLSFVVNDLKQKNSELIEIIQQLRSDNKGFQKVDNAKRTAEIGIKLGQTEVRLEAILKRIEQERNTLERGALQPGSGKE